MPTLPPFIQRHYLAFTLALLAQIGLIGCTTTSSDSAAIRARSAPGRTTHDNAIMAKPDGIRSHPLIPVIRYGRYMLVEPSPSLEQQDLMRQIVDVTMPAAFTATVGDALRYVLLRSGFELCQSPAIHILNTLPLPSADLHLGPLTLENALRLLAGPAWNLEVNEVTREVCFAPISPSSPTGRSECFPPIPVGDRPTAGRAVVTVHEGSL